MTSAGRRWRSSIHDGDFIQLGDLIITDRQRHRRSDRRPDDRRQRVVQRPDADQYGLSSSRAIGAGTALGEAAINFQNSDGAVRFGFIDINGSLLGAGINIGDRAGVATNSGNASFVVLGSTSIDEAGEPSSNTFVLDSDSQRRARRLTFGPLLSERQPDHGSHRRGGSRSAIRPDVIRFLRRDERRQHPAEGRIGPAGLRHRRSRHLQRILGQAGVLGNRSHGGDFPIGLPPIAGLGVDIRDNVSRRVRIAWRDRHRRHDGLHAMDNQTVSTGGGNIEVTNGTGVAAVHVDNTTLLNGSLIFDRIRAIAAAGEPMPSSCRT